MWLSRRNYESKLANGVKFYPRCYFAHIRRNGHLKQQIVVVQPNDGAVVTDSPNMARMFANFNVSINYTDEVRDQPSLPEPTTIMSFPHFTSTEVHKELSALDTAKAYGPNCLLLCVTYSS